MIEQTYVEKIVLEGQRIARIRTSDGTNFSADVVVLATGAWTSLIKIGEMPVAVEVKPIRGQMVCYKLPDRQLKSVIYSPRGYLVPRSDGRVLTGATVEDAGFNSDTTEAGIASLKKVAGEVSPMFDSMEPIDQWAGLRPFAPGGQPVIGRVPLAENLFVATAHYRNGILLAPLTAKAITDLITENRLSEFLRSFGSQTVRSDGKAV
jgi:glycine oxidase